MSIRRDTSSRWITVGVGAIADVGDVVDADVTAVRGVDHEVLDAGHGCPAVGRAPHGDLEHLLLLEEASDLEPGEHRRRGAAHVAWLQAVSLGLVEVDLDLDVGLVELACPSGRPRRRRRPTPCSWTLAAVASSVANDGPKTRTVMSFGDPVSKWRTRSSRYVLTLWAMPG